MTICSAPSTTTFPPALALLRRMASRTAPSETSYFNNLSGSTVTWNCLMYPPKEFTSATPGIPLNSGTSTQSCVVLRSVSLRTSLASPPGRPSSVYW